MLRCNLDSSSCIKHVNPHTEIVTVHRNTVVLCPTHAGIPINAICVIPIKYAEQSGTVHL